MDGPLLAVVIMVKNESDAMINTLLPFVNGGVKHICVFDTGSTDNTIEITKAFFETHDIKGFIKQEPFVDFSTSRNRAFELAEDYFPNATFFIMPDADWYIQNVEGLLAYCAEQKSNTKEPLYFMNVSIGQMNYGSPRLFRVSAKNRYEGVVHELPETIPTARVPEEIYFLHTVTRSNNRRSKSRYTRDEAALLGCVEKNPSNPRSLFYLAQTYECLNDLRNAYKYYTLRSRINGWPEEDVATFYRLGCIAEVLSPVDDKITWDTAMAHYLKAFALRSHRIEPLVKIANHYLRENPYISFVYMQYACRIPYPKDDHLFIQNEMYTYTRYDILSVAAWYVGDYATGKEATEMALRIKPDDPILKQKLAIYEAQLAKSSVPLDAITSQVTPPRQNTHAN